MNEKFLQRALKLAKQAELTGEVPVGAVIIYNNEVIGEGFNQPIVSCDPTAHAEIIALRQAAQHLKNYRLVDCDLYVTLQPCAMCAAAMVHARIKNCYFGAVDPKSSAAVVFNSELTKKLNHRVQVSNLDQKECADIIVNFFKQRR